MHSFPQPGIFGCTGPWRPTYSLDVVAALPGGRKTFMFFVVNPTEDSPVFAPLPRNHENPNCRNSVLCCSERRIGKT